MARRFGRSFPRGARKAVDWSASAAQQSQLTVAAGTAVLAEAFIPIVGGETVIRTRGMLGISSDQVSSNEVQLGAFGMCIVTAQAVSVGITAIPHPATDAAWGGWFYHTFLMSELIVLSAAGFDSNFMGQTIVIDSKAMRKVDEDERLVVVIENSSASAGFRIAHSERLLSKVH